MNKTATTIWVLLAISVLPPAEAKSQDAESQEEWLRSQEEMLAIIESRPELMNLEFEPTLAWWCTKVGFSATGGSAAFGGRSLMFYGHEFTNVHPSILDGLVGGSTFVAPCDGLYYFSVTFVKDPYTPNSCTTDDVFVYITQWRPGSFFADKGYAWAGQGVEGRRTGAYNVVLELLAGDWVQTWSAQDGGGCRHLMKQDFSGFLIRAY